MRTLFNNGIVHPRDTAWMGQGQTASVTTTPTSTAAKETSWLDVFAKGLETGGDVYESYSRIQTADEQADIKRAEADARASVANTALITKQTLEMQQAALANQNKIMGIDKTAFFVGASLLGLLAVGGTLMMLGKK